MATILNRYDSIMAMNACAMVEFAEDPMKMARHLEHHMEDDISKTKREGDTLMTEIDKLEADMSVPNAEALLAAKKAELLKLHDILEKLRAELHQITALKAAVYDAHYRKR